jgi:hypothetical protein
MYNHLTIYINSKLNYSTHSTWIKPNQNPKKDLVPHEGYGKLHCFGESHSPRKPSTKREFLPTGQKQKQMKMKLKTLLE